MLNFNVGLSALRSNQMAMDVIGNNIANANTPGYHRQAVQQVQAAPVYDGNFWKGTGVEVSRINQIASATIEMALTANIADAGNIRQSLQIANQIESSLTPSTGSIHARFQEFFDELNSLQVDPQSSSQQRMVISTSGSLAKEFNTISNELSQLKSTTRQEVELQVAQVNQQLEALTELNQQIARAQALGQNPNSLLDRHQQLVNQIAETIDIQAIPQGNGFTYQFAQNRISISQSSFAIEASFEANGTVQFKEKNGQAVLDFGGGRLAAMQHALNDVIPKYEQQISELATALIQSVDHIQATGVNQFGPLTSLTSHRTVNDTTTPLSEAGLPFDMQSGELHVTVYDATTQQRTQHSVVIDPDVDNLQEVAKKISQISNLQAVTDPNTQQITIFSSPGFGFDFSGQLPSQADRSLITGDAGIEFQGSFTGPENKTLNFVLLDSGQVGSAADLRVRVTDQAGSHLGDYQLGQGYEPGSMIDLGEGIQISIQSGTLNTGDSFSVNAIANSDPTGMLVGLGLNTFFEGSGAADIRVSNVLEDQPALISSGRSQDAGDGGNLTRLLDLRQAELVNGERSMEEALDRTTTAIAIEVNSLNGLEFDLSSYQNTLVRERQAISGVDPNEEMVEMLKYQRSFQAAVRIISTIDETLSELMNMIR